jgi:hypothetical protein
MPDRALPKLLRHAIGQDQEVEYTHLKVLSNSRSMTLNLHGLYKAKEKLQLAENQSRTCLRINKLTTRAEFQPVRQNLNAYHFYTDVKQTAKMN